MTHRLQTIGLTKKYGGRAVASGVSINVGSGEVVGLLGPNGAGKTTTFYMVMGLLKPDEGRVMLDEEEIGRLPMFVRSRMGIGYLPQEPSIFRKLTVRENIRAVFEMKGGLSARETDSRTEEILEEFHLGEFSDRVGLRLSGGERRRAEIARAIATSPKFLLFDEPFSGIDPIAVLELKKTLKYLKDKGIGVLITDHNVRDTLSITDRAYILRAGEVLDEGPPERLVSNPEVKDSYLGEEFRL